jgi:hypothetical protein
MSLVKDNTAIYTNRAQALILTGKYTEAINDCDWALRVIYFCLALLIYYQVNLILN